MWPDSIGRASGWIDLCLIFAGAALVGMACVRAAFRYPHAGLRAAASGRWPSACVAACTAGVLLHACVAAAFYWRHGWAPVSFSMFVAAGMLLALAIIDARTSLLPDALTLPLLWLGLATAWLGGPVSLHDAVAGAMAGYGFLWLLFHGFRLLRGREGMGYGDFKLFAALGAWLGPHPAMWLLLAACLSGLVFACARQKTLRPAGAYPFGPVLVLAGTGGLLAQCLLPG